MMTFGLARAPGVATSVEVGYGGHRAARRKATVLKPAPRISRRGLRQVPPAASLSPMNVFTRAHQRHEVAAAWQRRPECGLNFCEFHTEGLVTRSMGQIFRDWGRRILAAA